MNTKETWEEEFSNYWEENAYMETLKVVTLSRDQIRSFISTQIKKAKLEENERCQAELAAVFAELGEQGVTLDELQQAVTIAGLPHAMPSGVDRCKSSPHCSHNTNGRDLSLPCSIELK